MQWIIENKDWLFSGIGVAALTIIWYLSKKLYQLSWKYHGDGYFVPASLSYFSHSGIVNGKVKVKAKRIVSVHAVKDKEICIEYPINTIGRIDSTLSLSDPGTMQVLEPGQNTGRDTVKIKSKKGRQYIVASESTRTISPLDENKKPQEDNVIIYTLFKSRLTTRRHDFVGARVIGKTNTQRIVVEFSEDYKPDNVNVVQISKSGEIIRDERSEDFIMASHKKGYLFIVELSNPEEGSGIYVWWEWPEPLASNP